MMNAPSDAPAGSPFAAERQVVLRYPKAWEREYERTGTVREWAPYLPDSMRGRWFGRLGTLGGFSRGAVAALLGRDEKVECLADLYVSEVELEGPRGEKAVAWQREPRRDSPHAERIRANWTLMQTYMGKRSFDALQRALVHGGFRQTRGEPDLFCFASRPSRWFFAEAAHQAQVGRWQSNPSGTGWFDVALKTLGERGRVRLYRLEPDRNAG